MFLVVAYPLLNSGLNIENENKIYEEFEIYLFEPSSFIKSIC